VVSSKLLVQLHKPLFEPLAKCLDALAVHDNSPITALNVSGSARP
jgi:hypothetical protein